MLFRSIGGGNATYENGCLAAVPSLVGSTVSVAIDILQQNGFDYRIVDPTGYDLTLSEGTRNLEVQEQGPHFAELPCGSDIILTVDSSGIQVPMATTIAPKATTTTTP